MIEKRRFLIAAGGTGGHLFPALAVVEELIDATNGKAEFWFAGSRDRMESRLIPQMGFPYQPMPISGFYGLSLKTLLLPFKILKSVNICREIIKQNKIDAVIVTGAYIGYPAGLAAAKEKIPLFLLESNVNPGKALKMLAGKATRIFTTFEETIEYFDIKYRHKVILTGNPLRKQFSKKISIESARKKFGLEPNQPVLLVFGGSLGALSINKAVENSLSEFANMDLQLIWQTGKHYKTPPNLPKNIFTAEFIEDMADAYKSADLIVSRSGAASVAEICAVGKPSVLVPLPSAVNNEQFLNARALVNSGAAVQIDNDETIEKLLPTVKALIYNSEKLLDMSQKALSLAKPNAASLCAENILNHI